MNIEHFIMNVWVINMQFPPDLMQIFWGTYAYLLVHTYVIYLVRSSNCSLSSTELIAFKNFDFLDMSILRVSYGFKIYSKTFSLAFLSSKKLKLQLLLFEKFSLYKYLNKCTVMYLCHLKLHDTNPVTG